MNALTDRELLELAAKAAGIRLHVWGTKGEENFADLDTHARWNPLTDDGDALRLAVELRLLLNVSEDGVECMGESTGWLDESLGTDPVAATRRAIVRAAAALTQGA